MRSQAVQIRLTPIEARYEPMRSRAVQIRLTPIESPLRSDLRFERSGFRQLDS
ncbi:hypothetical protein FHU31_004747 [Mycolicibacterium fluoranthenivorans]|uniref:Uncharacterized protein n=1 Tax=Mycolicibacterium fluoranthenivorans TaxID=258505 RepID=A0A7X5U3G8_9MYCO|nr:hypothetical protein [Mycolicibacterium fluoranthenivorans]